MLPIMQIILDIVLKNAHNILLRATQNTKRKDVMENESFLYISSATGAFPVTSLG